MDRDSANAAASLARALQASVSSALPSQSAPVADGVGVYDAVVTDTELVAATRKLFADGHHSRAVEEGFKFLNNLVKARTGLTTDGAPMMTTAFSPGSPVLRLNKLRTQSHRDEQQGYMRMLEGAMIGVRNPRAHEHRLADDTRTAVELLSYCNHMVRRVRAATRTRKPR